jgi:release factor glutamine methyltransferase
MFAIRAFYPARCEVDRMTAKPTVAELLAVGIGRLRASPAGAEPGATPDLDARLLLAHVLALPRARLRSHPEDVVGALHTRQYLALLRRRAAGEPIAYLTGSREFWSLPLSVSRAVLVPRPETELLVERALARRRAPEGRVADLGTGSGAVALALASERPRWQVIATDVSATALEVARANAAQLQLTGIEFRQGSWFAPLAGERFDLLASNPPYVAADDPAMTSPTLAHEPRLALTPGSDALACLRVIVRGAPQHLTHGGWLVLEHGTEQGADVRHELVLAGFRHVRSYRDLAGHERITEGQTE